MSERVVYALQNTNPESVDFGLIEFDHFVNFDAFEEASSFANNLLATTPPHMRLVGLPTIEAIDD